METSAVVVTAAACILFPAGAIWLEKRTRLVRMLGLVLFAYLAGIAVGNILLLAPAEAYTGMSQVSKPMFGVAIMLAMPLLLLTADIGAFVRTSRKAAVAMIVSVACTALAAIVVGILVPHRTPEFWKISGMITSSYIGGTPNLTSVGFALDASQNSFAVAVVFEVIFSGLYMMFLMRLGQPLLNRWLPVTPKTEHAHHSTQADAAALATGARIRSWLRTASIGLAVTAVGIGVGLGLQQLLAVLTGWPEKLMEELFFPLVIVAISAISVGLSFVPRVRSIKNTEEAADYLILISCFSVGLMVDGRQLASGSWDIALFTGLLLVCTLVPYYLLCRPLGVDTDTAIIVSSACVFSPPLIPPVAEALHNRSITLTGVTAGIIGYAAGNTIGLLVAYAIQGGG